ncbi:mitogen-activated protein kinase kinase kinase A-like [Biomphalaria glabrata]|uniref:Mitogen-activated protein kinase kinase kinase A-like n=1 Tax=Biomphalaria glabrata TaxID=6526 RepID=A0A9W2ZFD4_BIOGL|nr:mitogen-activated protein kinase kinase kinase A-like [Biomphalaria glabrata]
MPSCERIVSYYGFLELEFKSFIFMEYIEEGSLRKYMSTNGRLNIDMIKHFTRQILQGVQYLHGLECVHRDIKPENVLIKSKNIKLADFGLARFFEEISKTYTAFTGTIRYMAPEVFEKGKSNSKSVDIWATGFVVLEMTTCDIPFSKIEKFPLQGLMSRDSLTPLDKQYLDAELPKETENFLSKLFTFDAKKRPTASILLKDTFLNVLMKEHMGTQTSADCADGNSQIISSEDIEEPSTSSNNETIGSQKRIEQGDFPKQIKHKFTQTIDSHAATKRKLTTPTTSITKNHIEEMTKNSNTIILIGRQSDLFSHILT